MISALFVMKDSIYKALGIDSWDEERDAMTWPGGNAIIAHPPCRLWGRLRSFSTAPASERDLAIQSVAWVRKYGGVLEHPAHSTLWERCQMPTRPGADAFGGYTLSINQSWFGHKAQKKTWLYICGCPPKDLPAMPLNFDAIGYRIAPMKCQNPRPEVNRKERSATPPDLAKWLIQVAEICEQNINNNSYVRSKNYDPNGRNHKAKNGAKYLPSMDIHLQ